MTDRQALLRYARALPAGSTVPVPREWLLELLEQPGVEGSAPPDAPRVDLTADQVAQAFGRSPATVRGWCAAGLLRGAYRLRGREWRIPTLAVEALQAGQRGIAIPLAAP